MHWILSIWRWHKKFCTSICLANLSNYAALHKQVGFLIRAFLCLCIMCFEELVFSDYLCVHHLLIKCFKVLLNELLEIDKGLPVEISCQDINSLRKHLFHLQCYSGQTILPTSHVILFVCMIFLYSWLKLECKAYSNTIF